MERRKTMNESKEHEYNDRLEKIESDLNYIKSKIDFITFKMNSIQNGKPSVASDIYNSCPTEKELDDMEKQELDEFRKHHPEFT